MSVKIGVIKYGVVAVVVAVAIVLGSIAAPTLLLPTVSGEKGTLAILLTDPPYVPEGVTAVYVTYSNFAIHVSNAGNESGWHIIQESGTIELLGLVNVSKTLSVAEIPAGRYEMLKFNITSALVTYNDQNYTAFVRTSTLRVPITGDLEVKAGVANAALIDLEPIVLNIGSESNPEFVIQPVARIVPVPHGEITPEMKRKGARMILEGRGWFEHARGRFHRNIEITPAHLTSNSLNVTVKNIGNETAQLRIATVSPSTPSTLGEQSRGMRRVPPVLVGTAVFAVQPDGSLQLLSFGEHAPTREKAETIFGSARYELAPGQSVTLTFSGEIVFGFGKGPMGGVGGVIAGQGYLITVVGQGVLAGIVVTAE